MPTHKTFGVPTSTQGFRIPKEQSHKGEVTKRINQMLDACKDYTAAELQQVTFEISRHAQSLSLDKCATQAEEGKRNSNDKSL